MTPHRAGRPLSRRAWVAGGARTVARRSRRLARLVGRVTVGALRGRVPRAGSGAVVPDGAGAAPAPADPVDRLREALALVAEAERLEEALPGRRDDVLLLARDRVVRRPEVAASVAGLMPPGQRDGWRAGGEDVVTLEAPVAADLVVLGKLDLQRRPKLRAVYTEQGVTLVVQPPIPSSGSGVGRAVRAHEVVERHVPGLIPPMLGHGVLGGGMPYLVERWLPGRPLTGAAELTRAAPRILAGLAALHHGYGVTGLRLSDHWGGGFRERWLQTRDAGVVPAELAGWVEGLIERDGTLRRSFIHGDLVASNVLATTDGVVLVDWEQAHDGVLMNDAAKLHLFAESPEDVLSMILTTLGEDHGTTQHPGRGGSRPSYLPAEELALCHAQLVSLYPRRRARLEGHARLGAYEQQVRRQVERLEQVRRRLEV